MASYYCNVMVEQTGSERSERADPDWTDVRDSFDALRKAGAGASSWVA